MGEAAEKVKNLKCTGVYVLKTATMHLRDLAPAKEGSTKTLLSQKAETGPGPTEIVSVFQKEHS